MPAIIGWGSNSVVECSLGMHNNLNYFQDCDDNKDGGDNVDNVGWWLKIMQVKNISIFFLLT